MDRFLFGCLAIILHSFKICYQQDITNVCPIGTNYKNGACVAQQMCPETHYLVNGACLLRPNGNTFCGFGFDLINGICVQQNCPTNFVMINGLCHEMISKPTSPQIYCPIGYTPFRGSCFPNPGVIQPPFCRPKPCFTVICEFTCDDNEGPTTTPKTTPETTATTSTTTTPSGPECPAEYIMIDGECRFVSCLKGTFYKGRCIEPVCTGGLVWTGLECAQPEVITTILEIENKFIEDTNQTGPEFHTSKPVNNVVYVDEATEKQATNNSNSGKNCTSTITTGTTKCCTIITPRLCKKYKTNWVCFNRQYRKCGEVCGGYAIKYLRVPEVSEHPDMLVIPPNPLLKGCEKNECKFNESADCSGCLTNQKQTCSPYCYRYRCPSHRCTFIDQSEYCTKYRGSPGCSRADGCFQNYCYEELSSSQDDC